MSPDDPRHGENAGYVAGCRCEPCTLGRLRYSKRRTLRILAEGPITVPPEPAAAHIGRCLDLGMRYQAFADAGVHDAGRIHRLECGPIRATTERQILAVRPDPGVNWWPTHGAVRRLQALIAIGYSQTMIGAELGISVQHVSNILHGFRGNGVRPDLWCTIAATYARLALTPGSSDRSRRRAVTKGWLAPLAWDDIDFDARPANTWEEPRGHYELDHAVVWRVLDGDVIDTTKAERIEIMRQWLARGGSERDLARRMGWKDGRYVTREDVA